MTGEWRKSSHSNPSGNCVEIAVVTAGPGDGLGGLRARYLRWSFWKGRHTGQVWAMPAAGGCLLSADSAGDLGRQVEDAEARLAR
jgi:hypothetical protein